MKRAIGYVRSSSQNPVEIGMIEEYCRNAGLRLVSVLVDRHETDCLPFEDRPGGRKYLAEARRHRARTLVASTLYSLFRDPADAYRAIRRLRRRDHQLHLVNFGGRSFVMTGEEGRVFALAIEAMGKMVSLTPRLLATMAGAKRQYLGYKTGQTPYGYKLFGDVLEKCPKEQLVLTRMRQLRGKGHTFKAIADELRASKVPTKKGGDWYPSTVRSVLNSNEKREAALTAGPSPVALPRSRYK